MLSGSLVALVTPMDEQGALDFRSLSDLIEQHVSAGTQGLVIAGTTGEGASLLTEELKQLVLFVVKQVQQRMPVMVGVGCNNSAATLKRAQSAQAWGADAVLVVTPYYNKPSQQGLSWHYKTIAQGVSVPVYLYNVPSRTGCDLLPDTVAQLAHEQANILGLKEACATPERHQQLLALDLPTDFTLLSGDDVTASAFIQQGAHGVISVVANVVPQLMVKLVSASRLDQETVTGALQAQLEPLMQLLFCQSNPIPVKWALHAMGRMTSGIRLPLLPLENSYRAALLAELQALKLISSKEYS